MRVQWSHARKNVQSERGVFLDKSFLERVRCGSRSSICGSLRSSSRFALSGLGACVMHSWFLISSLVVLCLFTFNACVCALCVRTPHFCDVPWTSLICVSSPKCVYMCVRRCPPPPPPKHQMRLYVCHQMRLYVCHQIRLYVCHQMRYALNPQRSSLRSLTFARFARTFFQQSKLEFLSEEHSCLNTDSCLVIDSCVNTDSGLNTDSCLNAD